MKKVGFVGAGKVACSMGKYLSDSDVPVTGYYDTDRRSADEAATFVGTDAFTDISDGIWMPLTWASYMLDFALWGDGNWGMFHVHSVLLHGVNAVLAFALLLRLLGMGGRAEGRKAILAAAGSSLAAAVKTTVYITNMDDFARVNAVYGRYFEKDCPARVCVEVSRLPKGALVEIDVIATR